MEKGEEGEALASLHVDNVSGRWIMYFDGAYSYEGACIGVVIVSTFGEQIKYVI
jgi:hypothetical protein